MSESQNASTAPEVSTAPGAATTPGTSTAPEWEQRFRAPRVSLPDWAEDAPDRSLFVSNATGTYELYAWDRASGRQRQVTDRPNGTTDGVLTPDGEAVWWFSDTDGDEFGVWMRQPFDGGADEPAVPGLAPSYPAGLAIGRDGSAVIGRSTDEDGTTIHLVRKPGGEPVEIYRHRESAGVGDLSHDGTLIALEHTEHGDAMHSALRVVRQDGSTVAELDDTEGGTKELGLAVLGFAPIAGDTRLLVGHQRRGRWEPMIWDPVTGTETALAVDLPGDVGAEWYPDGSALLIEHSFEARGELWRYEPGAPEPVRVETPAGTVSGATARPDGTVEYLWSSAAQPPVVRSTSGAVVLDPPGPKAPPSVPVEDAWVEGPGGRIHALVQKPATGEGPFPTIFEIHGGPTWHDSDAFASGPAAWVDHGFAVVRVNYRGSTGYGRAWTDALKHRVGLIELEDIAAVREWSVASGLADPERLVLAGGSWGGYLTLLGLGTQPDSWTLGLAAVPVADYVTAYHDEMEALKAMDRTLLGGTPEEVPERFEASSPLTYVDAVRAPLYISAGVNDPRCPIRQVENYVDRLAARGAVHEVYRYDAGHGSLVVEERIKQVRLELEFALKHLGGGAVAGTAG
ncbi:MULTISPECIES: S9 family peptidase [Streptomyces]|uniref:Prolyl oligopeptidase family serine peptidase n=2 Tax=Streptomyces TaxID=1883 RepID=A0AB33KIC4_9ACTN|nr:MULTISPECIES: prolyl oligopeptidase family serine peptidase [unclassified Streptomyces]WTC88189.1 prolyl oligopeptidase family serine peptidase [Streptomyces griseus]MDX3336923.1 prolyl oligopeptidase family serine peptidase [Streptomyces sp. ME02-6979.5a]MDX3500883.1 prolyl oligopeptidase family serine peptidase [Streptomyces sp. ATCC51928]MDX5520944.1 prolyl oligopeptidase family serine peptidase [Streptomyces sp. DE06-01C]MDX5576200.1 prolyl oligopeptidase family serine peptidase [Strept